MSKVRYLVMNIIGILMGHLIGFLLILKLFWNFLRSPIKFITSTFFTKHDVMPACLNDPSLGTHGYIQLEDVKLHYVSCGDEDKPLMLCLHGFPEFWYSWRYQIREFSKDYRVVAVDQRGYSESDKPSGVANYDMKLLCKDIKQLIPALGHSSCTLLAHDWGGAVAWSVVTYFPDMVDKLIVFNCAHPSVFRKHIAQSQSQKKKSWYMMFYQTKLLPELYCKANDMKVIKNVFQHIKNIPLTEEDYEAYLYTLSIKGALTSPINWYRATFRNTQNLKENKGNQKIKVPTLIVWGDPDNYLDTELANMCEEVVENLTVKIVENSCHNVMQDKPTECNRIVREFLKQKL